MTTANIEAPPTHEPAGFAHALARSLVVGVAAGAIAGLVWGGIGGRIAMRVVFLTSPETVRGVTSDDGFEIGVISGETMALLIVTTMFGAIAGIPIGLVRPFLSGRTTTTAAGLGLAVALAGGAAIVHPDGVDFVFLDPLWLTVGLFVLLPGAWAATVVIAIDRLGDRIEPRDTAPPPRWLIVGAWLTVGALATWGAIELISDIGELRRLR